jgi:choline dehydrogenase-like flavoprotein
MATSDGPVLTDSRRRVLAALADTFAPPARPPAAEADDPTGFWARRASDVGVVEPLVDRLEELLGPEELAALGQLLDLLRVTGFTRLPQSAREAMVRTLSATSAEAREGLDGLRKLALQLFYGRVGRDGRNPNWTALGYPGPPDVTPPDDPRLAVWSPPAGSAPVQLAADVVVVGSGAGGGVVAGELAAAGLDVVVLEAGEHLEPADFPADELNALQRMYWRGGLTRTDEGNVAILAGATLGGGTTINWQNCVRPPDEIRSTWATEHELKGADGPDFDAHLDAVLDRLSATAACTDLNGVNKRLADGAEALGWAWSPAVRNVDAGRYTAEAAGHVGYGDRTGAKQSTVATYLRDAVDQGARVVCRARATRVLVEQGRAAGVEAELLLDGGARRPLTVRSGTVVVAASALETPALLLRSGIGGPAAGRYLRLHPVPMLMGMYEEDLRWWWGAPQGAVVHEHQSAVDGFGYLVETSHLHPALAAVGVPWTSGREHKLLMGRLSRLGTFIAVTRDHGAGTVTLDAAGEAVVRYPLVDEVDARVRAHAIDSIIRLHESAGASVILDTDERRRLWRRGRDDLEAFVAAATGARSGAGGRVLFSAHQMGSARMGPDPATSVADPEGQLHDVPGVWIGDAAAFPTAVGINPMLTCMALARRTAHAIVAVRVR